MITIKNDASLGLLKTINIKSGSANAIGHTWTAKDYARVEDRLFEIHYLYTIAEDKILEKELKRVDITEE